MQKSLHIHITKKGFVILATVLAVIIGVAAPFSVNASLVHEDTKDAFIAPGPTVIIYANPESSDLYIPRRMSPLHEQAVTATINVNYIGGGWTTEAQTAFQYAADIWETLITSPVTIEVDAEYKDLSHLGAGILGAAGPTTVHRDFTNAPVSGTWYPQAVANKLAGTDLASSDADIAAAFNSAQPDWYFGTGMTTPVNKYSFVTVALHELGHGLGFLGSMDVNAGVGSYGIDGYPFIYDTYTENNAGTPLVNYTNPSTELATHLQSGNVFFDAPYANYANSGARVELYAPGIWKPGSSYSHLDEWANGTSHALMTYSVNLGETLHDPGAVVLCMFKDMGWTVSQQCSDSGFEIYLPLILKNYSGSSTPPDAPTLISPSNGSTTANTTPTFSWSTSSGATQYQIQIDNNADFSSPEQDQTLPGTNYTPASALSDGTYNWRVRASNGSVWSDWSNVWTVMISSASGAWTIIESQDFEGAFPGTGWILGDTTGGTYSWAKRTCRPYAGSNSAWAVGGGSSGSGLSCGNNYPNDVYTWMDYGPFDLSDATAAEMQFKFWANTEPGYDYFCYGASIDNTYWDYFCGSGTTGGWFDEVFDLSDYLGASQVWITFEFDSDETNEVSEGAYVDNVVIRKCTFTSCSSPSSVSEPRMRGDFVTFEKSSTR